MDFEKKTGRSAVPDADHRGFERTITEDRAIVRKLEVQGEDAAATKFHGTVLDISPTGLQLFTKYHVDAGEQVEVCVRPEGFSHEHVLQAIVRWQKTARDAAGCLIGVELVKQRGLRAWRQEFH